MPDATLLSILTGTGVAGVFCVLFIIGWVYPKPVVTDLKAEITELKEAVRAANDRANTAVAAQATVKDILAALAFGQQHAGSPPGSGAGGT